MHWLDMGRGLDLEALGPERSRAFDRVADAIVARKWALLAAALAAPLAVALFLIVAPLEYRAEARLAVEPAAGSAAEAQNASPALWGDVQLIASRAFGRRAINELGIDARLEFDPLAVGVHPVAAAFVFLGLAPDPARLSRDERILKSFEDRLGVSVSGAGLLKIAFRSHDRVFAATAANRIADLYLEMRGRASRPGDPDGSSFVARMISPAVDARQMLPARGLLLEIAAAAAVLAALAFRAWRRPPRRRGEQGAPMEPPRTVGDSPVFVRLGDLRRPLSQAGQNAASSRAAADDAEAIDEVARRIASSRREGGALRIVGAGLSPGETASGLMLALARQLGNEGRSILIRLDDSDGTDADPSASGGEPGVRDLIAATASFAEAIRRDPRSRLHIIPGGRGTSNDAAAEGENEPIDLAELGGVLDALTPTYDFIWLLAPPLEAGDMAQMLAGGADFFVLATPPRPRGGAIAKAEAELRESGARDILVVGAAPPARRSVGRDAA